MEAKELLGGAYNLIRGNRVNLTGDDVVELTPKGKDAANSEAWGDSRARVLFALGNGATTVRELASDCHMPIDKVKTILADLMKRNQVRKVGFEG